MGSDNRGPRIPPRCPVLIATLGTVTRRGNHPFPQEKPQNDRRAPATSVARLQERLQDEETENDRVTAAAIDACLQKLTGAKPPGKDRAVAWSKWWQKNVRQIMAGKDSRAAR